MIQSFWKQSAIYGLSTILIRAVSFLLLPLYTTYFTTEEAGYIYLLFTFIAFAQVFYNHGMDSSFLKFISQDEENSDKTLSTTFIGLISTSIILSLILHNLAEQISMYYLEISQPLWISICSLILCIDSISGRMMAYLRVQNRAIFFALISISNVIVTIALNIYFIVYKGWSIDGVLYGTLAGALLRFVLLIPSLFLNINYTNFEIPLFKKLFSFGIPFFPAALFFIVMEMADRKILHLLTDVHEVGIYSVSYKLGSILLFIITGFNLAWQPLFHKEQKNVNRVEIFSKINSQFILFLAFVGTLICIWMPYIVKIPIGGGNTLINEQFWDGIKIVPVILSSHILYAGYIMQMPSLYDGKNRKWSPLLRGMGAVINIGFNFLLIPIWGVWGAAFSTLIAYGLMFLSLYLLNRRWLPITFDKITIFTTIGMCTLCYFSTIHFTSSLFVSILITICILFYIVKIFNSLVKSSLS